MLLELEQTLQDVPDRLKRLIIDTYNTYSYSCSEQDASRIVELLLQRALRDSSVGGQGTAGQAAQRRMTVGWLPATAAQQNLVQQGATAWPWSSCT
jgi:hypothetical protein